MSGYNDVNMLGSNSYSNSMSPSHSTSGGATEAIDLDSGGGASFLSGDPKHHDDLKEMLDSSKESLKLEAMKRIISMVARGRDASDLFPAVVKNVVSKNLEIKKLVYVYLTRYAEEQQDLALLSISTFQRALKDPNQLIRASALRVLSSIRVPVIVPIMMLAIRDASVDMSPFVRKTAAHAIPKAYSIDPDQKEELVNIIEKLLGDRTTLVVGSAVMAFEEVCPDRIDLIHKQFRKLCHLLVDVEEWGQVVIVNMLLRYGRTQFVDPNIGLCDTNHEMIDKDDVDFYKSDSEDSGNSSDDNSNNDKNKTQPMDPDHRLLLKSTKPLLQSRNAAVVMAVAQLYHHCAPRPEIQIVAKAMIRLLRSHTEVQAIVLNCIASMTSGDTEAGTHNTSNDESNYDAAASKRKPTRKMKTSNMFEPHLRNFFVRNVDPSHIKILKLEIMTNLATEANIGILLREFQSYITSQDKVCVAATIQAIGRCASTIDNVTDTCLNGLVQLLSNRDQAVVAESVVVIKKLLQTQAGDHKEIIIHMAKLMDTIKVPAARAAILWVLGEYSDRVPKVAPDVLRKMAKSFTTEENQVKMQILNLATKLVLINPDQTQLLAQYIFNLAKYDKDYDLRDRARFMRAFIFPQPGQENNCIIKHSKKIFLASKPAPVSESRFKDREIYQLGSMSHYLNSRAPDYQDLPDYPDVAPDPSVRNVEPPKAPNTWGQYASKKENKEKQKRKSEKKKPRSTKGFYSDDESSAGHSEGTNGSESSGESDSEGTSDSSSSSDNSLSSASIERKDGAHSRAEDTINPNRVPKTNGTDKNPFNEESILDAFSTINLENKKQNVSKMMNKPHKNKDREPVSGSSDTSSSSEDSDTDDSDGSTSSDKKKAEANRQRNKTPHGAVTKTDKDVTTKPSKSKQRSNHDNKKQSGGQSTNLDLLLSLGDDIPPSLPSGVLSPSVGSSLLTPLEAIPSGEQSQPVSETTAKFISTKTIEMLNRISTGGLQLSYRYTRLPYVYNPNMTAIEMTFLNHGNIYDINLAYILFNTTAIISLYIKIQILTRLLLLRNR